MTNSTTWCRAGLAAVVLAGIAFAGATTRAPSDAAAAAGRIAVSPPASPTFAANAGDPDVVYSNGTFYAFTTGTVLGNHLQVVINTSGDPTAGYGSYTGQPYGSTALPDVPAWQQVNTQTSPGVASIGGHWVMWYDASLAGPLSPPSPEFPLPTTVIISPVE